MKSRSANLLTLFSVTSIITVVVIFSLIYFGIRYIYQQNIIEIAEHQSVGVAEALFAQERKLLTAGDPEGADSLAVSEDDFERLDNRMRRYLAPFNIIKIKVFARDTEIVYSTDPSIIGTMNVDNPKLNRALQGAVIPEMETKDSVTDLSYEERIDVDVVETYLPVDNEDGRIIGSFEVYLDMTPFREQMSRILQSSMLVIGLILLATFAIQFIIVRKGMLQLDRYEVQLHTLSITDELTGIANRRAVLNRAKEEFSRLQRMQPPEKRLNSVGSAMVDIDFFKKINDTYGHAAGDAVLKEVAERIHRSIREYDILGRYGGEEFLVMFPHTNFEQTMIVATRIWNAIREKPFVYDTHVINVTISVGIACTTEQDKNIDETIRRADEGLYKAKETGRDQICSVQEDPRQ